MASNNSDPLPADDPMPANDPSSLADLRPIFELDQIVTKVLEDMGLGTATASTHVTDHSGAVDFSVLHFLILPQRSVWLDFMLEADRSSTLKLFEIFADTTGAADHDLEDMLRETMNLIHGSLKAALKATGVDVIIPLVPQSIASEKIVDTPGGVSLQSRHIFGLQGMTLRFTMIARVAPITHKQLKKFRLAEVLIDAIVPEGEGMPEIVKKHTMLNRRLLEKVRHMSDFEDEHKLHAVITPSPLAELLPND